jgi:hypothetical protein
MASLGLFAPVFDTTIERGNYSKVRLREIIVGDKLSGGSPPFTEMDNTRTVLCEQIGAYEETDHCGQSSRTATANFGSPIAFKNGVTISSTGKTGVFGSSGFVFTDTSAQLFTPVISTVQASNGGNPFYSTTLLGASLVQTDSKNFVAYVSTENKLGFAKLTVSNVLPSSASSGVGPATQTSISNTLPSQTPFSFNSLLRVFRRVLNQQ